MGIHRFKHQFICSKNDVAVPPDFKSLALGDYSLHYDKNLSMEACPQGVLLGHALDWTHPSKSNAHILDDLLAGSLQDAVKHTDRLGGRWALIFLKGEPTVLADGGGTLSIVWTKGQFGSSAKLLAACDPEIAAKHRPEFDSFRLEGWHSGLAFLATDTEFEGVDALLPNHLLFFDKPKVERFYPARPMPRSNLAKSIPRVIEILQGLVRAAALRSQIVVGLTSGYDSRLIVAAAASVPDAKGRISCVTFQDEHATPEGHFDIEQAAWIATTAGFPHRVEISPSDVSERAMFRDSEGMVAPRFEEWAQATANVENKLFISCWASEIGRAYLKWPGSNNADVTDVLACNSLNELPSFTSLGKSWLDEARDVQARFDLSITDLIYWELRVGRWNSACFNILSLGSWWMTLYTCRDLFETMISIPFRERGDRGSNLYSSLIDRMCPALLARPFNPMGIRERAGYFLRRDLPHAVAQFLIRIRMYNLVRRIKRAVTK